MPRDKNGEQQPEYKVCKHAKECKYYNQSSICNENGGYWGDKPYCGVLRHFYREGQEDNTEGDVSGETKGEKRGEEKAVAH